MSRSPTPAAISNRALDRESSPLAHRRKRCDLASTPDLSVRKSKLGSSERSGLFEQRLVALALERAADFLLAASKRGLAVSIGIASAGHRRSRVRRRPGRRGETIHVETIAFGRQESKPSPRLVHGRVTEARRIARALIDVALEASVLVGPNVAPTVEPPAKPRVRFLVRAQVRAGLGEESDDGSAGNLWRALVRGVDRLAERREPLHGTFDLTVRVDVHRA